MNRSILIALLIAGLAPDAVAQTPSRVLSIDGFLTLDRVSDPQFSPDGQWITYTVTATDLDGNT